MVRRRLARLERMMGTGDGRCPACRGRAFIGYEGKDDDPIFTAEGHCRRCGQAAKLGLVFEGHRIILLNPNRPKLGGGSC